MGKSLCTQHPVLTDITASRPTIACSAPRALRLEGQAGPFTVANVCLARLVREVGRAPFVPKTATVREAALRLRVL